MKTRHRNSARLRAAGAGRTTAIATRFDVEEKEIHRSIRFRAAATVDVDNFDGSITVTGSNTGEIQVVGSQDHSRASRRRKIQEAKRDVKLDIAQSDGGCIFTWTARIAASAAMAPSTIAGSRHYGYEVSFDFTLKVPRETNLRLRTVNHGDISVKNTSGTFDVDNVNGGVEMLEVAGSGHAYALEPSAQGDVQPRIRRPTVISDRSTALVEVAFRPDLNADLRMKTFNGDFYTDFEVTRAASRCRPRRSAATESSFIRATSSPACAWAAAGRSSSSTPSIEMYAFIRRTQ